MAGSRDNIPSTPIHGLSSSLEALASGQRLRHSSLPSHHYPMEGEVRGTKLEVMEAHPREPKCHLQVRTELKDQKRPPVCSEARRPSPMNLGPTTRAGTFSTRCPGASGGLFARGGQQSRICREEPSPPPPTAELGCARQAMSRVKIEPEEAWLGPVTTPACLPACHTLLRVCPGSQRHCEVHCRPLEPLPPSYLHARNPDSPGWRLD